MKYNSFDGSIEELIQQKLHEIEETEHVKILYAVESGSRSWGFASPDSDYDVRFVYIRQMEHYLKLEPKKDFIDWELNETLDINGWDVSKVLQHFHKSNAVVFEWANSPVVYHTTPEWEKISRTALSYFACKPAMYHYYSTANKTYLRHLTADMVNYKKYFYILRPLLSCKWIEKNATPPPVFFNDLMDEMLEEPLKPAVLQLISAKTKMLETDKGPKNSIINKYIENSLVYFKQQADSMKDDRKNDWNCLNKLFLELLKL